MTSPTGHSEPAAETATAVSDESLQTTWARIRGYLQQEVGDTVYRTWLRHMTLVGLDGDELTLTLPTPFHRDWVRTHYGDRIGSLWQAEHRGVRRLDFRAQRIAARAGEGATEDVPDRPAPVPPPAAQRAAAVPATPAAASDRIIDNASLEPRFSFDNFVVGKPNEFAYACARRVADFPSTPGFNPLFLYGPVGLGKTHLMHAIGLELAAREGGRAGGAIQVAYMSAETFMVRYIAALRSNSTPDFKGQLRSVDVLMVDDIQFLIGKDNTQEEFFHTFNALVDSGRQIVVSADKSPAELDGLENRLSTRLGCGLVADLHQTTFELRMGILESKAARSGVDIPTKVLELLAHKFPSNVRDLEGCLNRLVAKASLMGQPITLDYAQETLRDLLRIQDRRVAIDDIMRQVVSHFGLRAFDMTSSRKARAVARPRQVAMYLAKILTDRSLPEIGRKFGNRDHTTVMHAVARVQELMAADPEFKEQVDLIAGLLRR